MTDNSYRNRIAERIRRDVGKAQEVNTDYKYLLRNKIVGMDWKDREAETANTPAENAEFKRQTKNLEYMAIPPQSTKVYRLQGL